MAGGFRAQVLASIARSKAVYSAIDAYALGGLKFWTTSVDIPYDVAR